MKNLDKKPYIFFALLATIGGLLAQERSPNIDLGVFQSMQYYVETDSLKKEGSIVRYRLLAEQVNSTFKNKFSANIGVDCVANTRIEYSSDRNSVVPEMRSVYPGTRNAYELNTVCKIAETMAFRSVEVVPPTVGRSPSTNEIDNLRREIEATKLRQRELEEQLALRDQWVREQQANSQRRTSLCMASMLGRSTKTGSAGESMANAVQCRSDSNAHLTPPPPSYVCRRDVRGNVQCDPQ